MIKEAIDRILQLAVPNTLVFHDMNWTDKQLHPVKPLVAESIKVQTLDGFIDLVKAQIDGATKDSHIVHVIAPTIVALRQKTAQFGIRLQPIDAQYTPPSFTYGNFIPPEAFVICLQTMFKDSEDLNYVLQLASNVRDEKVGISQDDGVSQTVSVRAGVALREGVTVKKKVTLAPMRTFPEVEQPSSEFLLRMRSSQVGEVPSMALFEAEAGAWKSEAIDSIAEYLRGRLAEYAIVS